MPENGGNQGAGSATELTPHAPDGKWRLCDWLLIGGSSSAPTSIRRISRAIFDPPCPGVEPGFLGFLESYVLPPIRAVGRPPNRIIMHAPHGVSSLPNQPFEFDAYLLAKEHPELDCITCLDRLSEFAEAVYDVTGWYPMYYVGMPGYFDRVQFWPNGNAFLGLTLEERRDRIKRSVEPYAITGTSGILIDASAEQLLSFEDDLAPWAAEWIRSQGIEVSYESRPARNSPAPFPNNWANNPNYDAVGTYPVWTRSDPLLGGAGYQHLSPDADVRGRIMTLNTVYPNQAPPPPGGLLLYPRNRMELIDTILSAIQKGHSVGLNWHDINVDVTGYNGPGNCSPIYSTASYTTDDFFDLVEDLYGASALDDSTQNLTGLPFPYTGGCSLNGSEDPFASDNEPLYGTVSAVLLPVPSTPGSSDDPGIDYLVANNDFYGVLPKAVTSLATIGGSRADPWLVDTDVESFVPGTDASSIREGRIAHRDPATGLWKLGVGSVSSTSASVPYLLLASAFDFEVIDDTVGLVRYAPPDMVLPIAAVAMTGGLFVESNDFAIDDYFPGNLLTANDDGVIVKMSGFPSGVVLGVVDTAVSQANADYRISTLSFIAHFQPLPIEPPTINTSPQIAQNNTSPVTWTNLFGEEVGGGVFEYY